MTRRVAAAPAAGRRFARLVVLLALASALAGIDSFRQRLGSGATMCRGLPDYGAVAASIPADAAVVYLPDAGLDRQRERFFCARFALAPRLVADPSWTRVRARLRGVAWRLHEGRELRLEPPAGARRR